MNRRETLLVFARHPEPGRVKTRLAQGIGEAGALAAYRRLLAGTLRLARAQARRGRRVVVWVDPAGRLGAFRRSWGRGLECRPQGEGPLGARLARAEAQARREGALRVVLIGSDCPGLGERHLEEAFSEMGTDRAALGPALDGGYYLIGLAREVPRIFDQIPWGTPGVLAATLARLGEAGVRPRVLETLRDVDEAKDLAALETGA